MGRGRVRLMSARRERRAAAAIAARAARRAPRSLANCPVGSLAGPQMICLSMIVRNEAHVIRRCLDSVRPFLTHWAIVDTGSTDGTREIIREHMRDIPGQLVEREWPNRFDVARNWALDLARESGAAYALFADADDVVEPVGDARPLRRLGGDVLGLSYEDPETAPTVRPFLLPLVSGLRWAGAVHEDIDAMVPTELYVLSGWRGLMTTDGGASRAGIEAKQRGYLEILRAATATDDCLPCDLLARVRVATGLHEWRDVAVSAQRLAPRIGQVGRDSAYVALLYRALALAELGYSTRQVVDAFALARSIDPRRAESARYLAMVLGQRGELPEVAARLHAEADSLPIPPLTQLIHADAYRVSAPLGFT